MNIAQKVIEARIKQNISVYELSKISGVTQVHIHQIEKGETKNPGVITLYKLAKALNTTINDLLN